MTGEMKDSMLAPYRVLDLADDELALCGKTLADLGADVIKVEKPGGDQGRNIGPFYHDIPDPEQSLFWFAYNCNKRGITLDLESDQGRDIFRKLVANSDVVIESFSPGHLDKLGLGYTALKEINPKIILTSITPFGQDGPYRDYKGSDLACMAMGGYLYLCGDPDRPPVRVSVPQIYLHGALDGAVGTMMALYHRQIAGEGQRVDIPIWLTLVDAMMQAIPWYDQQHFVLRRSGTYRTGIRKDQSATQTMMRQTWRCKDGWVNLTIYGGPTWANSNRHLAEWIAEEGMANDFIKEQNWEEYDGYSGSQSESDAIMGPVSKFLLTHTKAELLQGALERDIRLCPVNTIGDIVTDPQLRANDFWITLQEPKLGGEVTYPGAFIKASETPLQVKRVAPRIGEHNEQVYKELGLSKKEHVNLRGSEGDLEKMEAKLPLDGVKVLDFTWIVAGPIITKYLADFGAIITKIESRKRPDSVRGAGPYKDDVPNFNRSMLWNLYNANKNSISINMNHRRAIDIVKRLVSLSDVVTENFTPGTMEKWGLGYEDLKKIKPDIIMFRCCMEGHIGPRARRGLTGAQAVGMAGMTYLGGWPDRDPVGPYGAYTDVIGPRFAALAIVAALDYTRRTGKGQCLQLSQYEAAVRFLTPTVLDYTLNRRQAERMGNACARAAPHSIYRCQGEDRWCAIAVFTDEEWEAFCQAIGSPQWTTDPRFATLPSRKANEDILDRLVEEWTVQFPPEEVMRRLQAAGVSAGVVQDTSDLCEDPHLREQGLFWTLDHNELGPSTHLGQTIRLSKTPAQPRLPAPCLGQDTEYVMTELLGMSTNEFVELLNDGLFE